MKKLIVPLCATTMLFPSFGVAQTPADLGLARSADDIIMEAQPPALRQTPGQKYLDDLYQGKKPQISEIIPEAELKSLQTLGLGGLPQFQKHDYSLKEEYLSMGEDVEVWADKSLDQDPIAGDGVKKDPQQAAQAEQPSQVKLKGILYRPNVPAGPGVIYLHGDQGLRDIDRLRAAQLASKGFTVLVPDLYQGVQPRTEVEQTALVASTLKHGRYLRDWYYYLQSEIGPNQKIGVVGFEMGGQLAMRLAVLGATDVTVLFYPDLNLENLAPFFKGVKGPVLGQFAQFDPRISQAKPELFKRMLFKARKPAEIRVWPNLTHGFADVDNPHYDKFWADLTWARTNVYFREYLLKRTD